MYNYVLALALISSPEFTSHVIILDEHSFLAEHLASISLDLELLDPRERRYVFVRPEEFANDLRAIQDRYQKLCNAPFAVDGNRFPKRELVNEVKGFNREYKKQIEFNLQMSAFQNKEYWKEVIKETDYLYRIWDLVRDANCDYYYVTVRREALKNLRIELGDEAYYNGELPPYVPIWRFHDISTTNRQASP